MRRLALNPVRKSLCAGQEVPGVGPVGVAAYRRAELWVHAHADGMPEYLQQIRGRPDGGDDIRFVIRKGQSRQGHSVTEGNVHGARGDDGVAVGGHEFERGHGLPARRLRRRSRRTACPAPWANLPGTGGRGRAPAHASDSRE